MAESVPPPQHSFHEQHHYRRFWFWISTICALSVATIFFGMDLQNRALVHEEMLERGRNTFAAIVRVRAWNANYGGVYVEKAPNAPTERHLQAHDITTTDGRTLTLKNPALMTREISTMAKAHGEPSFHITSTKPLNPFNAPDAGEREALLAFDRGAKELHWLESRDNRPYFRYMAPLKVEHSCLSCHAEQGYRVGDVRGGISVTFDQSRFELRLRRNTAAILGLALVSAVIVLLLVGLQIKRLIKQLASARLQLEILATTDTLTEIWNRRHIMNRLSDELERHRRTQAPLSCALIDIDHFKRVNDTLGHHAGDLVLKRVAESLKRTLRRYDLIGRYGGEEFLVILPNTDSVEAKSVCERLHFDVSARVRAGDNLDGWAVTVSIGCATLQETDSPEMLVHRADTALYQAKESGRNSVVTAI
jgi:diguanylate cyclase (GGDEF)-like protein